MASVNVNTSHTVVYEHYDDNMSSNVTVAYPSYAEELFELYLYQITVPIMFGLTTLIGVIGNCLVIYVILSKQKMRTVTNLLLLNLACADLAFVLICPPFTAYQMATMRFPFGNVVCKMMHYLLNVTAYVTVYTLVLISIIRYMTIVHNTNTMRLRTRRNIVWAIIAIWVVMLTLNTPITLLYGIINNVAEDGSLYENCELLDLMKIQNMFATFFAFAYVLPLFIIAVLSIRILRHIQKQKPSSMLERKTKTANKKKQASRVLILVVVIFALLWLPIHIHLLVAYFGTIPKTKFYMALSILWNILAYFNSCVNPIIYNYASKDFRDGFRDAVRCMAHRSMRQENTTNGNSTVVTRLTPESNGKDAHLLSEMKGADTDENEEAEDV